MSETISSAQACWLQGEVGGRAGAPEGDSLQSHFPPLCTNCTSQKDTVASAGPVPILLAPQWPQEWKRLRRGHGACRGDSPSGAGHVAGAKRAAREAETRVGRGDTGGAHAALFSATRAAPTRPRAHARSVPLVPEAPGRNLPDAPLSATSGPGPARPHAGGRRSRGRSRRRGDSRGAS